jgi:hypothetical protein
MSASRRSGLAAAVAAIGFVVAYLGLIWTETGQHLENMALRGARQEFESVQ